MFRAWILLIILCSCNAEIYHLNDTEYVRLPPVWSLEPYAECSSAGGTYCVLQLQLYAAPGNQLMHTIQEYSAHTRKHYNHSVVDRGVCVSTSCAEYLGEAQSAEELRAAAEACSRGWARAWGLRARVLGARCTRGARRQPRAGDWAALAALLALAALNCAASAYHIYLMKQNVTRYKNGNQYLLSFSVLRNWERLTNISFRDPKSQDLQFLHGARVISQLCTIMMHVVISMTMGFVSNPHDIEKTFDRVPYYMLYNGMMIVQIFFFISGFLTCYIAMQAAEENRDRTMTVWDLPKILLLRLSRLFPALVVTVALVTSWLRHAGSGPLWEQFVTSSLVADCRSYWWHHLLFINNYMPQGKHCLIHTWHLATDMQVFVVAVLAFLVSRRVLLPLLLLLSVAAPAVHTWLQDLDAVFITPEFLRKWESPTFWGQHALGHTNLACFIFGMMTASRLYEWKKKGGHLVTSWRWSLLQYVSLALIPATMITGGLLYYTDGPRAALWSRAIYSSLVRVSLSGACALIAFSYINRSTSYLKSLFAWRGWVVPSRLTYCVFLLHMPFIHMMAGYRTELVHYSFYNVMLSTVGIVAVSLAAAVVLHLSVEAPFIALFKVAASLDKPSPAPSHIKNGKVQPVAFNKEKNIIVVNESIMNKETPVSVLCKENGKAKNEEISELLAPFTNGKSKLL